MSAANGGTILSERDAIEGGQTLAKLWIEKIKLQIEENKDWSDDATMAIAVYEASRTLEGRAYRKPTFNIFHSNIETLVPAVYNSTPVPDVRRRFGDKDAGARLSATICERALVSSLDGYDFDGAMKDAVRSACVTGQGQARVRYLPIHGPSFDVDGQQYDALVHEEVQAEPIRWNRYVQGPAQTWEQVPWIALLHDLTQDECARLMEPDGSDPEYQQKFADAKDRLLQLPFGSSGGTSEADRDRAKGVLQTIPVWEVWDKTSKSVLFVTEHDPYFPLTVKTDPLGLANFFPVPKPIQIIRRVSSMRPVCPHNVYADLIEEIEDVTRRIRSIIKDMRIRALSDPKLGRDLELLKDAGDGEVINANSTELFLNGQQLKNLIAWWPVEQDVAVLQQLMAHRESIKQIIYEVTGISDILRGATNPNETLGAQQIKATWGSQRVQELQQEIARFARDLLRLKAEVIFGKFQDETIRNMTLLPEEPDQEEIQKQIAAQVQQTQQAGGDPGQMDQQQSMMLQAALEQAQQQAEDQFGKALAFMRSQLRFFKVDVETDSTVRADLARDQQRMNEFLQGTATFGQAMAQIAQVLPALVPGMTKIYTAMVRRTMRLGKSIEDVLDNLEEAAEQAPQQQQGSDPQAAEQQAAQQQHEQEMQRSQQAHEQSMAQHDAMTQQTAIGQIQAKDQADANKHGRQVEMMKLRAALPPGGAMPNGFGGALGDLGVQP